MKHPFTYGAYYWARFKFSPSGTTLGPPMIVECVQEFGKPSFQRAGSEEMIRLVDLVEFRGPIKMDATP